MCRGFKDFGDGAVRDGLAELEGRRVGLYLRRAHSAALVGIEGDIIVFGGYTAFWWIGLEVERTVFNDEILSWYGPAAWDFLEDDTFVLNHCDRGISGPVKCSMARYWGSRGFKLNTQMKRKTASTIANRIFLVARSWELTPVSSSTI